MTSFDHLRTWPGEFRVRNRCRWAGAVALLLACGITACGTHPSARPATLPLKPAQTGRNQAFERSDSPLPKPSKIKIVSAAGDELRIRDGADYVTTVPANLVAPSGDYSLAFAPQYAGSTSALSAAAYAVYSYKLDNPAAILQVSSSWSSALPPNSTAWLGLSNWTNDTWSWIPFDTVSVFVADFTPYANATGDVLAAVVLTGQDAAVLDWLRLGGNAPPVVNVTLGNATDRAPRLVTFDATQTRDIDGSIASFEWDWWGDGTYDLAGAGENSPTYQYWLGGTYAPILRLTDNDGASVVTVLPFELGEHSPWWRIGGDRKNTRHAEVPGPQNEPSDYQWFYETPHSILAIVIGIDGTVYLAEQDKELHAVDPVDGSQKWIRDFGNNAYVGYWCVGPDGALYNKYWNASSEPRAIALNPDNTIKWDVPYGENPEGCLGITLDGLILFGDHNTHHITAGA